MPDRKSTKSSRATRNEAYVDTSALSAFAEGAALKTTANISELKSRLSSYLADVQRGEEIIVRDRNRPVARLAPLTTARGGDAEEAALVASGVLRLPLDEKLPPAFWTKSRSSLTESRAARVVRRERCD